MTIQNRVTVEEAEAGLSRLIEQVRQGEEIVLVENGVAVARIVATQELVTDSAKPKRQGGFWAGRVKEIDPDWWKPDDELADLFEGSESRFDERSGIPKAKP